MQAWKPIVVRPQYILCGTQMIEWLVLFPRLFAFIFHVVVEQYDPFPRAFMTQLEVIINN